ncbi:MAG: pectate lyase [Gemmatimonadaceae bacterium]
MPTTRQWWCRTPVTTAAAVVMGPARVVVPAILTAAVSLACASGPARPGPRNNPIDSIARLPGWQVEADTGSLLAPARLAALPAAERGRWEAYVARSRELSRLDHRVMAGELAARGRDTMARAPWTHAFEVTDGMTTCWFGSDSARRIAESILSYQTPSGGWSKHVDFAAGPRAPGQSWFSETSEWRYIATIDNSSTTEEIRFLARIDAVRPDARYRQAVLRGIAYLLDAQMPTGCWPQVYPLQGGYHDAATFNDDAIVHVSRLLRDVRNGEIPNVPASMRRDAGRAVERAVDCMLGAQVVLAGRLTVWGQQHDPLTLAPVSARSYELASLTGHESAGVASFLLSLPSPNGRVVRAVHAAADWFRANRIDTLAYHGYMLEHRVDAAPLWARMVDLETGRPIFSNRDGVKLYDFERLTDRRTGYRWFTPAPADFLRDYASWSRLHPRG